MRLYNSWQYVKPYMTSSNGKLGSRRTQIYRTHVYEEWPWSENSPLNQSFVISLDQIWQDFHCFWREINFLSRNFSYWPHKCYTSLERYVHGRFLWPVRKNILTIIWSTEVFSSCVWESPVWSQTSSYHELQGARG